MISRSSQTLSSIARAVGTTLPPGNRRNARAVKCPECAIGLSAEDVRPDAVLLRRVRRAQELSEREKEDESLEESGGRHRRKERRSGVLLSDAVEGEEGDSDVDMDLDGQNEQTRVKAEPGIKREVEMEMDSGDEEE